MRPRQAQRGQVEVHVLGHVEDVGILAVDGVALGPHVEQRGIALGDVGEGVAALLHVQVAGELLAEVVGGVHQRAAGMLLLGEAEEVGRVADVGLHLLLAVAEVVVGDDRHDHAAGVARADLEGGAAVVALVLRLPALAVAPLAGRGLVAVGQAQLALGQRRQVRGEDHAAGVAGPAGGIERGVVLRPAGVAGVVEDGLDEIQVGHQRAGREEPDLHPLLADEARHGGHHEGMQQQRDEAGRRPGSAGGVGQRGQVRRRLQRLREEAEEHALRHLDLVVGHGQAARGDVEDALGRAPVVGRVVQHAVAQAVALEQGRDVVVAVGRKTEFAGQPRLVEHQRAGREARHRAGGAVRLVEPGLDARIRRTQRAGAVAGRPLQGSQALLDGLLQGGAGGGDGHGSGAGRSTKRPARRSKRSLSRSLARGRGMMWD
jgi:hypothetical protein